MTTAQPETQPRRTTRHRRVRAARKPAIGALAAATPDDGFALLTRVSDSNN
ncbi:hypothetical protein ACFT4A_04220 [Streptomyces sp. NPDC057099]|uniref:hypothetical protein n=1 Tax=Streptomyces sp. NPDC057099 TaxID=3346019 RepID=UPI003624AE58